MDDRPDVRGPFRRVLTEHPPERLTSSKHKALAGDDRWTVRLIPGPLATVERLRTYRKLVDELTDHGVSVAQASFIIAPGTDGRMAFALTRWIEGVRLDLALEGADGAIRAVDRLGAALAAYYDPKLREGGGYLVDMGLRQFVFSEDSPVLVDLDPVWVEHDPKDADALSAARIHSRVADVANMVIQGERISGSRLPLSRAALDGTVETLRRVGLPGSREHADEIERGLAEGVDVAGVRWVRRLLADVGSSERGDDGPVLL